MRSHFQHPGKLCYIPCQINVLILTFVYNVLLNSAAFVQHDGYLFFSFCCCSIVGMISICLSSADGYLGYFNFRAFKNKAIRVHYQ